MSAAKISIVSSSSFVQKRSEMILKNPEGKLSKHLYRFYLNYLQFFLQTPPHGLHFRPPLVCLVNQSSTVGRRLISGVTGNTGWRLGAGWEALCPPSS